MCSPFITFTAGFHQVKLMGSWQEVANDNHMTLLLKPHGTCLTTTTGTAIVSYCVHMTLGFMTTLLSDSPNYHH